MLIKQHASVAFKCTGNRADDQLIASTLMSTVYTNNPELYTHSVQVAALSIKIAQAIGLPESEQHTIFLAAYLHDIGKLAIPGELLAKPAKLTTEEFKTVQKHSVVGYRILSKFPTFFRHAQVVLCHHERFDGNGYPRGIAGKNIPLASYIISVADAFDAMTSKRIYQPRLSIANAKNEIQNCSGSQFDPTVAAAFVHLCDKFAGTAKLQ